MRKTRLIDLRGFAEGAVRHPIDFALRGMDGEVEAAFVNGVGCFERTGAGAVEVGVMSFLTLIFWAWAWVKAKSEMIKRIVVLFIL